MNRAVASSLALWALIQGSAFSSERLRVTEGNADATAIKDCIRSVERAANAEDLDGYMNCFTDSLKKAHRRKVGIVFAQHDVGLEIADMHLLECTEMGAEVAVKYQAVLSAERADCVSSLIVVKEAGHWRISGERVHAVTARSLRSDSSTAPQQFHLGGGGVVVLNPPDDDFPADIGRHDLGACANGRCGVR